MRCLRGFADPLHLCPKQRYYLLRHYLWIIFGFTYNGKVGGAVGAAAPPEGQHRGGPHIREGGPWCLVTVIGSYPVPWMVA